MSKPEKGFGEFIQSHRKASGFIRQKSLAESTGISAATISRIEKEKQVPEVRTLQTLALSLKTTSYHELMKVCGYGEVKEGIQIKNSQDKQRSNFFRQEYETLIDLSESLETHPSIEIRIDGKDISEIERKIMLAAVRAFRELNAT